MQENKSSPKFLRGPWRWSCGSGQLWAGEHPQDDVILRGCPGWEGSVEFEIEPEYGRLIECVPDMFAALEKIAEETNDPLARRVAKAAIKNALDAPAEGYF
jgi:hypothetical protein